MKTDKEIYSDGHNLALQKGYEGAAAEKFAENYVKGYKIGLEKGEIKGKTKTAIKLLKKGMSIEDISDATELPIEQIEQLIKENNT